MATNPLTSIPLEIYNFKCFDDSGSGTFQLRSLNFVIGRNNAGKSAVVDFLEVSICRQRNFDAQKHNHKGQDTRFAFKRKLSEDELRLIFRQDMSGGDIHDNHWNFGSKFVGQTATYLAFPSGNGQMQDVTMPENYRQTEIAMKYLKSATFKWPFNNLSVIRVSAERDVQPEPMTNEQLIQPNGRGLTNAITKQITDASLSREIAERDILADLNEVYQGDAEFSEIVTRIDGQNNWEIYLREVEKGDVRLSESGSGLKTILLIVALMRIYTGRQ